MYGSKCGPAAAEDSSVLEMPALWDDQEQPQQWNGASQTLEDKQYVLQRAET